MVKQIGEVLRSYEQRCRSLVAGTLVAGGFLQVIITLCVAPYAKSVNAMLPFIAMGMVFLGMHLWLQLRLHLLTTRRFTWPGYVAPQLAVFFIFATLLAVSWPASITLLNGRGGIGLTAMMLAMFAVIGWCIVVPSMLLVIAATVGYLWLCFSSITAQRTLLLDTNPAAGAIVLLASMALILMAVYRLARINEETPSYNKKLNFQSPDLLPKMTGQQADASRYTSRFQLLFFAPAIHKFIPRPGNRWDRTRRWRYLTRTALWFPLGMAFAAFATQLFIGNRSAASAPSAIDYPSPVFLMWLFISGGFVMNIWLQSWRYLEMEFVRPISRRALLKDFALAMSIQTFQSWFIMALTVLGVWMSKARFYQQIDVVIEVIGLSLASQIIGLVVGFTVMPLRSPGGVLFTYFGLAVIGGGIVGLSLLFSTAAPWIAVAGSIALLLGAAALLPVAIRRWDVTDLG